MVHNYMETLVAEMLRDTLANNSHEYAGVCCCALCRAHIMVVALNDLTPFYITGASGKVYGEYLTKSSQNFSDITAAIGKGIAHVTAHPPHP